METHPFKLNENLNVLELSGTLYSHLVKAKAVTSCLLSMQDNEALVQSAIYHAIWAVDDYLDELLIIYDKLSEMVG